MHDKTRHQQFLTLSKGFINKMITINDIITAYEKTRNAIIKTPLITSDRLNKKLGFRLWVKCEMLQRTGSFKFRGACNAILSLPNDGAPILAYSSGNHAQAVALNAKLIGRNATLIMPKDAPMIKRQATTSFGASIYLYDRENENREKIGDALQTEMNAHLIPPFNDERVIAGQGTLGIEIAQQCKKRDFYPSQLIVCCGGGGLIAGTSISILESFPNCNIFAAEPEGFDDMKRSLAANKILSNKPGNHSICDAIITPSPGKVPFEIAKKYVNGGYVVTDQEVCDAMRIAFRYFKLVTEPGGAVALASAFKPNFKPLGQDIIVILSGGNVDETLFSSVLTQRLEI